MHVFRKRWDQYNLQSNSLSLPVNIRILTEIFSGNYGPERGPGGKDSNPGEEISQLTKGSHAAT